MEKTKKKKRKSNNAADAWKLFRKNKAAMAGLVVLAVFVFFALFADLLIPYEAAVIQSPKDRLMAPCMQHWLGAGGLGREMIDPDNTWQQAFPVPGCGNHCGFSAAGRNYRGLLRYLRLQVRQYRDAPVRRA